MDDMRNICIALALVSHSARVTHQLIRAPCRIPPNVKWNDVTMHNIVYIVTIHIHYIHTFTVTYIHEHDMTVFPFLTWNVMKRHETSVIINKTIVQTSGAYWVKRLRNLIPKLSPRLCAALCRRVPPESLLGVDWRLSWVTEWKWLGLTSSFDPGTYSWSRHQSCSKKHASYEEIYDS